MKVISTSDVPLETLWEFKDELRADIEVKVDERQVIFKAAEAPSWITFLAAADWWVQVLATYAALYVAEIVKEAAKDTWRDRAKAISAVTQAAIGIKKISGGIAKLRKRLSARTGIKIGLPIPDEYFATWLELYGTDTEELEIEIALFVHHLRNLSLLMQSEKLDGDRVLSVIQFKLLEDGSLEVAWIDKESRTPQKRVLSLDNKG
jgi:hypothetical protein